MTSATSPLGPCTDGPLLVARHDAVAVLTLNRPERRNALSSALLDELRRAVTTADADPTVSVVVLAAEGTPIDDQRASAAYRSVMLGNALRGWWAETDGRVATGAAG